MAPPSSTTPNHQVLFDSDEMEGEEVVDSTPYMAYREVACNTFDEKEDQPLQPYSPYVLIPSTFNPGKTGKFRIIVLTSQPLEQPPVLPSESLATDRVNDFDFVKTFFSIVLQLLGRGSR